MVKFMHAEGSSKRGCMVWQQYGNFFNSLSFKHIRLLLRACINAIRQI